MLSAVTLAACTQGTAARDEHPVSTPAPAATTPPLLGEGEEPMHGPHAEDAGEPPVWDDAARHQAIDLAREVMVVYARPDLPQEEWWAGFATYLSDQARYDYQWVDPAAIPARAVTGEPRITDESSVYLARVEVPTDAGPYEVLLSRQDGPTPWRVERITPPTTQPAEEAQRA